MKNEEYITHALVRMTDVDGMYLIRRNKKMKIKNYVQILLHVFALPNGLLRYPDC